MISSINHLKQQVPNFQTREMKILLEQSNPEGTIFWHVIVLKQLKDQRCKPKSLSRRAHGNKMKRNIHEKLRNNKEIHLERIG